MGSIMVEKARIGDVLVARGVITQDQLKQVLAEQKKKGGFLGQLLVEKGFCSTAEITQAMGELSVKTEEDATISKALIEDGLLSAEQLEVAKQRQKETHQRIFKVIADLGYATPEKVAQTLGKHWGVKYMSLTDAEPKADTMQLLPEEIMRRYMLVPVDRDGDTLVVAMVDPLNIMALDEIRLLTNSQVDMRIATERDISLLIDKHFSIQRVAKEAILGMKLEDIKAPLKADKKTGVKAPTYKLDEGPIIKIVDTILDGGINSKASDIHMEPQEFDMRIRYRIDGILHDILAIPKNVEGAVVSRLKVMADMNIAEKRAPQDGHITMKKKGKEFDLRVSSFGTVGGEKIVLRVLDKDSMKLSLDDLGLAKTNREMFEGMVTKPYGIFLVTGPTGSGKTTTLYTALSMLNTLTKNIITVEDPVEYKLKGVNQAQINPRAGVTFASGLKARLRQDPDIIMVGEIRDKETAEIAIRAALTGHLVFSTLHTNDAPTAVTRLIDMGIEPFLISSSVIGVLAQRLVRTICPDCKEKYDPNAGELKDIGLDKQKKGDVKFTRGKGCHYCIGTGYRGRIGIYELMKVTETIKELIINRAPDTDIKKLAVKEGMSTLKNSCIDKVLAGVTTYEEARRTILSEAGQ